MKVFARQSPAFLLMALLVVTTVARAQEETLEVVTVQGQKIGRSLEDTKESVAVITTDVIEYLALLDLEDIFNQTANAFEIGNGENFGIRGVTRDSESTGGGNGELGSLYIDGEYRRFDDDDEGPAVNNACLSEERYRTTNATGLNESTLARVRAPREFGVQFTLEL